MFIIIIIILIGVYAALCLFLFLAQSKLLYYPEYPSRTITLTPKSVNLSYETISFETEDSVKLFGWFVPRPHAKGTVIIFHGNAGNISHRVELIQLFYRIGLNTFIFDYRGYGQSEGRPSEHGTYLDAEATWLYLTQSRNILPGEIVLFGRSLGGPIAAWLAQKHNPAGLIIESSFTSIPELAAELYPYLPVKLLCRYEYNTREYVTKIRCPIFIIHNVHDEIVPFKHGQKLFEKAQSPKEFLETTGSHNELDLTSRKRYEECLNSFMSRFILSHLD